MSTNRTTAGLVGDLLASLPPNQTVIVSKLATHLQRDRGGVKKAVEDLSIAGAISSGIDPSDHRRTLAFMTEAQGHAWRAGAHETSTPGHDGGAVPRLRFAMWDDGAIAIEGLARKQLTIPALETGKLAETLASLPEGALQALSESALKPSFTLAVGGRSYPLTAEQSADLVAYIEQLPAKAIRAVTQASRLAGVAKPGTDHRVHRLETAADLEE